MNEEFHERRRKKLKKIINYNTSSNGKKKHKNRSKCYSQKNSLLVDIYQ